MLLSACAPYLIVLFGICLGIARVRPALLAWATCMLGALGGLGLAIWLLTTGQPQSPIFAAIAALPFAVVTVMTIRDLSYPRINDVTTDVINAPDFVAALDARPNAGRDMAFPDPLGPIISKAYPDLRPLCLDTTPQQVFRAALGQMNATSGWAVTHRDETGGTIEAEVTTAVFGFVDDVIIRITDKGGRTRVDMRSKSREGLVDGGHNAQRIWVFLERMAADAG